MADKPKKIQMPSLNKFKKRSEFVHRKLQNKRFEDDRWERKKRKQDQVYVYNNATGYKMEPAGVFAFDTQTDSLAIHRQQVIKFHHVPSGKEVWLKAALTAFNDSYTSEWNSTPVFGRMDPIATFKRSTRLVNFGVSVMAANLGESKANMSKISLLTKFMYPLFENTLNAVPKGGPLWKISFMNWIGDGYGGGLLGYVDNVSFVPDLEPGVFAPGPTTEGFYGRDKSPKIYPKKYDLNFSFHVIHEPQNEPGWVHPTNKTLEGNGIPIRRYSPYRTSVGRSFKRMEKKTAAEKGKRDSVKTKQRLTPLQESIQKAKEKALTESRKKRGLQGRKE